MPVEGQGGVTLSHVCPHCHRFHLEDHIWWVTGMGRSSATGGVRHVEANTTGEIRTESWSYKKVRTVEKQLFSERALRRTEFVTN